MGYAFNVDVKEIADKAILDAPTTLVKTGDRERHRRRQRHGGPRRRALRLEQHDRLPLQVAERADEDRREVVHGGRRDVPGRLVHRHRLGDRHAGGARGRRVARPHGGALSSAPTVATHDADVPRVAIYSQWSGTQELGWYRHAFDQFGIPFDLIFKERVAKGNLKADYDVILMAAQNVNKASVMAAPAAKPQPYQKTDKYKFLGMYGETPDMSGGFGQAGVDAIEKFLDGGGTLITTLQAVRFPIEFGLAHTVDTEAPQNVNAQKPLIQAEIMRTDHPVFYGYDNKIFPIKFGQGSQVFRVGVADQGNVLAQYVGGDASVLSGLMVGADNIRGRAFAVDIPQAHNGNGRVIMFANNPIYRWQNHGEFNMVFNSIMNWNDVPAKYLSGTSPVNRPILA